MNAVAPGLLLALIVVGVWLGFCMTFAPLFIWKWSKRNAKIQEDNTQKLKATMDLLARVVKMMEDKKSREIKENTK